MISPVRSRDREGSPGYPVISGPTVERANAVDVVLVQTNVWFISAIEWCHDGRLDV